jgi:hypothetical protein
MTEPSDGRRMTRLDATALALVRSVAFGTGSDGWLRSASAGGDGTVRLWEVARGLPAGRPARGTHRLGTVGGVRQERRRSAAAGVGWHSAAAPLKECNG